MVLLILGCLFDPPGHEINIGIVPDHQERSLPSISVYGFSAGSYTGAWIIDILLRKRPRFAFQFKELVLGALNFPPEILADIQTLPQLSMIQISSDKLSLVDPVALRKLLDHSHASLFIINAE